MKIAISDYDGTLCLDGKVSRENIEAIKKWRQAGHFFGLASGRDFNMTYHAVRQWNIEFDFLICTSGATIFDSSLKMIHRQDIDDSLIPILLNDPAVSGSLHYIFCRALETFLYLQYPPSWFPGLNIPYTAVTRQEALTLKGVQQINLAYHNSNDARVAAEEVEKKFAGILSPQLNGTCVDITTANISKASGILHLLDTYGWPQNQVYTIGDGHNDLPMIRMFIGASVPWAVDEIKKEAGRVYDSVAQLLIENI